LPERGPEPDRADSLRAALRARAGELAPGSRLVASDLLAAESRVDLLLAGADGRAIAVVVAEAGHELAALARAIAHARWIGARLRDWKQLAPDLPIDVESSPRAMLLVPEIGAELAAAAAHAGVELRRYLALRTAAGADVLLLPSAGTRGGDGLFDGIPKLRTALTDRELGLTPEESAAFED
jgi:hypothetical protein